MLINLVFCLQSFAQKRHRKYLNEQDHSQMSNLGSFSAEIGNIIKTIYREVFQTKVNNFK